MQTTQPYHLKPITVNKPDNYQPDTLKMIKLFDLLVTKHQSFLQLSQEVEDLDLKNIILQIMRHCRENREQINPYLPGNPSEKGKSKFQELNRSQQEGAVEDKNIIKNIDLIVEVCRREEMALEKGYRKILNCNSLKGNLRTTLQHQLNDLKTSFLKIRILYLIKKDIVTQSIFRMDL